MEPAAPPRSLSKAEYARLKGVHRSNVTRWAAAGRLAIDDETGQVLVAESEARLAETADVEKVGVVHRHAEDRGAPVTDLLTQPAAPGAKKDKLAKGEHYNARVRESARHEAAKAEKAEIELAQIKGELTDVEGTRKANTDFGAITRQTYDRIAFDLKHRGFLTDEGFAAARLAFDAAARKVAEMMLAQADLASSTKQ